MRCDHIAVRTSSYTGIDQRQETSRVHAMDYLVSHIRPHDRLLIIDDVFDSGRSLEAVIDELQGLTEAEIAANKSRSAMVADDQHPPRCQP